MRKASWLKREREQSEKHLEQKAMNDMWIVLELMKAVELDDLELLKKGLSKLEQSGCSVDSFEINDVEVNGVLLDLSLIDYALFAGSCEVPAWLIRQGVIRRQPAAMAYLEEFTVMLNGGGHPQSAMDRCEELFRRITVPYSIESAKHVLSLVLPAEAYQMRSMQLLMRNCRDLLATHVAQCGV